MKRRSFLSNTTLASAAIVMGKPALYAMAPYKDMVIGHNSHQYKIDLQWGALNSNFYPVKDCHEMVQDSQGRILLLTNHTKNNVIIYDKSGKLIDVWGTEYPGAHGLTLNVEGGEDFLYIADNSRHEVIKTTLSGQVVQVFPFPEKLKEYQKKSAYIPTETAIADNGDVYVADGYGSQYIIHYDAQGNIQNVFGGRGDGPEHFDNAHGICIDKRDPNNPTLLITARMQNKLKRFSLEGQYLESYDFPGAYICRPVIHGNEVYLATIWSDKGQENSGFVSILDKDNRLVSAPGGCAPIYENGVLGHMHQAINVFSHPHDVCVDEDDNLYVAQWNSGQTYPIKLYRA